MVSVSRTLVPLLALNIATLLGQEQTALPFTASAGEVHRPAAPARPSLTSEQRADIFMARKMYREAVDLYRSIAPETAVTANKLGIAYHQMLQIELAKKQYERSIKLDGKYSEAINNLGTVNYALKKHRRAVNLYNRALKLRPQSASILSNLGTAQFARKKYKDALLAYDKALAIDPDVFERRGSHGVLLQERNVEERAKFHFYMAKTYAKAGSTERALLYIRKALEEGFQERSKFLEDSEFEQLRAHPEFEVLMALQPRVL